MLTKSGRKFGIGLKVAIVLLAAGYIVRRFFTTDDPVAIASHVFRRITFFPFTFLTVLLLMPLNWMLEAWKWKLAAGQQVHISFANAMRGVLAGVTTGTATPNRIGEFAGRIFMEKEADRVPLLFLSFVCSFCQVTITFFAGITGMLLLENNAGLTQNEMIFIYVTGIIFCCVPLLLPVLPAKWKEKTKQLRQFPLPVFSKILFLSAIRYSIYVIQFMLLVRMFRPELFCLEIAGSIMVSYLVVTMVPTFSFTEVFIRGSIAGLIFSAAGFGRIGFLAGVLLWLINVAIPSLVGTVYVFRLKFTGKEKE
ncbi:hypothetical protein BH11BAC7_BH11BAC7_17220 [soil metagenome]